MSRPPQILCVAIWFGAWQFGFGGAHALSPYVRADDATQSVSEKSSSTTTDEKASGQKIAPDKFSEVDKLTSLTIVTLAVFIVGVLSLLALIVVGARRIRRLTRSPSLKSKYDELEYLRAKYHREVEGLDTPPPPSREVRR